MYAHVCQTSSVFVYFFKKEISAIFNETVTKSIEYNKMRVRNELENESKCNLEKHLGIVDLQHKDVGRFLEILKLRTTYYEEEIAKMESVFHKMRAIDAQLNMFEGCVDLIEKLNHIQQKFNLKELTPSAVALSYAHKLRKQNDYSAKLKVCLNMYIEQNLDLTKRLKQLKSTYDQGKEKVGQIVKVTVEDLKATQMKISRYEQELIKLEGKYPWLKNDDYSLPNILKEINLLIAARKEKEELVKELHCYCGLKPNLEEASEQLAQIKVEYEEISKKLLN